MKCGYCVWGYLVEVKRTEGIKDKKKVLYVHYVCDGCGKTHVKEAKPNGHPI